MSGVMMVALVLSAVTVVTMSAPRTASAVLAQTVILQRGRDGVQVGHQLGGGARVDVEQAHLLDAHQQVERERLELALRAVADHGHHAAVGARARRRATITDVAAVRIAVVSVSSLSSSGRPVSTSASRPKAITVGRPARVFFGWPLTYLKL